MSRLNSGRDSAKDDGEQPLSDAEIEAILELEADAAPESNLPVPPIPVVMREPGQGRRAPCLLVRPISDGSSAW